jgi:hypothetical protein
VDHISHMLNAWSEIMRTAIHTSLRASFLSHSSTLLCARFWWWNGGSSLGSIAKDCWVFPLIEKGFPRINSCVLVHGYSSCDLGLLELVLFSCCNHCLCFNSC